MRWAVPLVLLSGSAWGESLHCLAVNNYLCDPNGCGPTSMNATTADLDGDILRACSITGCSDLAVEVSGSRIAFTDSQVPSVGSLVGDSMVIVSQYALIVQMAFYECE